MEKQNKLERIFWKKGKFVDSKDNEVNLKQIGKTHATKLSFPLSEGEIIKKADSSDINAYMIGSGSSEPYSSITEPCSMYISLSFYKI
jgi:hypothetical protein